MLAQKNVVSKGTRSRMGLFDSAFDDIIAIVTGELKITQLLSSHQLFNHVLWQGAISHMRYAITVFK